MSFTKINVNQFLQVNSFAFRYLRIEPANFKTSEIIPHIHLHFQIEITFSHLNVQF
jgi:hypothetical protein